MAQRVAFGELLPDQPAFGNPGLVVAENCLPGPMSYRPLPSPAAIPNGDLGATPLGAYAVRANGVVHLLAGDASRLRRYQATGWANLATGLTASSDVGWRFDLAGVLVLATNGTDPIKKYTLATGVVANLGGSPPTARYLAIVRGRVLAGYTGGDERAIAWSAEGDPESWTAAPGGPGAYEFASGGAITGLGGGEIGLIFQETAITRAIPAYGESAFQLDTLSSEIGCIAPWSLHRYGRVYRFLSAQGWVQTDGASAPMPIGKEKIDRTYMALADRAYFPSMSAITDPKTGVMFATVPNASAPTAVYMFDPTLGRWTTASFTAQRLFAGLSQSVTLEQLDATNPDLDAMTTSLDSRIFQGGYPELMFFDGSNNLCALTGESMAATFTLGELELTPGLRSRLRRVLPLTDATADATLTLATRNVLGETQTETDYTTRNRAGQFTVRQNARFVQPTLEIAAGADWSYAMGLDIEFEPGGRP
jgi:hypothetical protein